MRPADGLPIGGRSRLEEIFERALDTPFQQRRSMVAVACAGDPDLETRVLRLLEAHEIPSGPLDVPLSLVAGPLLSEVHEGGPDGGRDSPTGLAPGTMVGPYRVARLLARGGMGTVYLAERADGAFEQRVALKVVNAGIVTPEIERRFLRERQILARLDHPGIARLLHGGLTPGGHPYLAMEYVEGVPVTTWAEERGAGLRERLRLFLQVCNAIHYAHGKLIVHRDLKPSNILVTADGRARLLDFGIARLLAGDDDELSTRTGVLLLTPEYAAPELLRGESVSTSTDVYALGVILFELLTGERPFETTTRSLADLLRQSEREAPTPSRVPGLGPGRRRQLEGDLDAIVGMALRREPARRYASVESLADDVRAFLEHRPVLARPDTRAYRVRRFVRRHAVGVVATAALVVSVVGGLVGTTWMAAAARQETARSEAVRAFLFSLWEGADPNRHAGKVPTALDLVDSGAERMDSLAAEAGPEVRADMLTTLGFLYGKLGEYGRAVEVFERAVSEARAVFGTDERTGGALDGLAQNLVMAGRAEAAESVIRESLAIRLAAGSPDTAVASSYSTLGAIMSAMGRYDEARGAHLAALELDRGAAGPESAAVATDLSNLGAVARNLAEYEESERYLREANRIRRKLLGDLHPDLATSLGLLGSVHRELGDYAEAERLEREALDIRRTVLGPDHPDVAISLNQLGLTLQGAGRVDEADSLASAAVELYGRVLGEDHPATLGALNNLATTRFRRGEYARASEAQEGVVAAARAGDPELAGSGTLSMVHNLGVMRLKEGDAAAAERLLNEALEGRRSALGGDHPDVASSLRWLSELRRTQGRFDEAESLGREALASFERKFPPGHARLAEAQVSLGAALVESGRPNEAVPLLRDALQAREAVFSDGSLPVAEARVWLGTALARAGETSEGRQLLEAALGSFAASERLDEVEAVRARHELASITPSRAPVP